MVVRWPWRLWVCALALHCIAAGAWSATQFLFCPEWAHWISHPDRHTSRPVTIARQAVVSSPGVYTLNTPGSRSGSEGEFLQNGAVSCACSLSVLGLGFWVMMSMFTSTFPRTLLPPPVTPFDPHPSFFSFLFEDTFPSTINVLHPHPSFHIYRSTARRLSTSCYLSHVLYLFRIFIP